MYKTMAGNEWCRGLFEKEYGIRIINNEKVERSMTGRVSIYEVMSGVSGYYVKREIVDEIMEDDCFRSGWVEKVAVEISGYYNVVIGRKNVGQ